MLIDPNKVSPIHLHKFPNKSKYSSSSELIHFRIKRIKEKKQIFKLSGWAFYHKFTAFLRHFRNNLENTELPKLVQILCTLPMFSYSLPFPILFYGEEVVQKAFELLLLSACLGAFVHV